MVSGRDDCQTSRNALRVYAALSRTALTREVRVSFSGGSCPRGRRGGLTRSTAAAAQEAFAPEDIHLHDRAAEEHACTFLHAFGDRRMRMDAVIDVVERRFL